MPLVQFPLAFSVVVSGQHGLTSIYRPSSLFIYLTPAESEDLGTSHTTSYSCNIAAYPASLTLAHGAFVVLNQSGYLHMISYFQVNIKRAYMAAKS